MISDASGISNLPLLKRRRAIIKSSCTRTERYVDLIVNPTPEDNAQLLERLERLNTLWQEYGSVQSQIELLDESESSNREVFEDAFYTLCGKICQLTNSGTSSRPSSRNSHESNTETLSQIRLPKLNLPNFSGTYEEWFPFYDSFMTIIHNNTILNDIQKYQYLRASLTGEALNIIRSLEVSDRNYELAWNLLKERYDNKRIIVQSHIRAIMELPNIARENAAELRAIADGVSRHVRALTALQRTADKWDDLLIFLLSAKLDPTSAREWHASLTGSELPTLKRFVEFIAHRGRILEATGKTDPISSGRAGVRAQAQLNSKRQAAHVATERRACSYCNGDHATYACKDFLALPVPQRIVEMRKRNMCLNCLRNSSHVASKCTLGNCRVCKQRHNTILHVQPGNECTRMRDTSDRGSASAESRASEGDRAIATHAMQNKRDVLLSTAIVHAYDRDGVRKPCRVLLDLGSQANFVTRRFMRVLRLEAQPTDISICGIGGTATTANEMLRVRLRSRTSSFITEVNCIVTDLITSRIPASIIARRAFKLPASIELADPQFNVSADVDILIGADTFWQLLCVGQIRATADHPTIQKMRLGWILAGRVDANSRPTANVRALNVIVNSDELHMQVSRFWRLEELTASNKNYNAEEQACETHFISNVGISDRGRYIVRLPTKDEVLDRIGDSREIALRRFCGLERRFSRDAELKDLYIQFMREYQALGHMRRVSRGPRNGLLFATSWCVEGT